MKKVISEIAKFKEDNHIGIVWGGGDPTANPFTYEAMRFAKTLGVNSSFLTNGVFMDVDSLLGIEPEIIRVSLDCGTEKEYMRFHGYPPQMDYYYRAVNNIKEMNRRKAKGSYRTLFGISLIIDERNLKDIVDAARLIESIVDKDGKGIDYVIVRPVMQYKHFDKITANITTKTNSKILELISEGGMLWSILKECDIPLIPVKDSFNDSPADDLYTNGTDCLAYGMCGEIRHNGDVQICSDSYGDPQYTIGNLVDDSIENIWKSTRRKKVLKWLNDRQCYKYRCPHNGRGHHHNRIFHQIEIMRRENRIGEIEEWVNKLQAVTLPLGHSFFI
jgi:radical SAM protein with 4Fe4S-binding SPASM domain